MLLDEALWKKRAAECRRIAALLHDPDERALMLRLAAVYEVMAICRCRTSLEYDDACNGDHSPKWPKVVNATMMFEKKK